MDKLGEGVVRVLAKKLGIGVSGLAGKWAEFG
jgi:hypothetical protein